MFEQSGKIIIHVNFNFQAYTHIDDENNSWIVFIEEVGCCFSILFLISSKVKSRASQC